MVARYRCWLCQGRWKAGGRKVWEEHYRTMHYEGRMRVVEARKVRGVVVTPGNDLRPSEATRLAGNGVLW